MKHLKMLFVASVIVIINLVSDVSAERRATKDLELSEKEKKDLAEFKEKMSPKLPHEYMKENTYLVRWLWAKEWDMMKAETLLLKSLEWRKEEKMDMINITSPDRDLPKDKYPYQMMKDREGNPVMYINIGMWDIREASHSSFQRDKLVKYYDKITEEATLEVIELQKQGKNVTRWTNVFNIDNLSVDKHFCILCLAFYTRAVVNYDRYYPYMADRIVVLNDRHDFNSKVVEKTKPFMNKDTKAALEVYDSTREKWEAGITSWIDPKEIPA